MKGPIDRTKVVLRHLPPTISQSNLVEHVDSRFSGRYGWLAFRPGKSSPRQPIYSRAYIDFNTPEDVIEFAEFFNGHIFVNEKGTQFKAIVEYAPSQRVPKQWSKKDGRDGTLLKDPEYLEFLEFIAKPVVNLPSAEIQLERKEAERAGAPKNVPVVTPLMDYIRQKRAAKGGARRTVLNGKPARRVGGTPSRNLVSGSSRRGSEKRRTNTTMYVLRDNSKIVTSKENSAYSLISKQDDQQLVDKSVNSTAMSGNEALEGERGGSGSIGTGKKVLLLKGKEKEIFNASGSSLLHQNAETPSKTSHISASSKPNPRRGASGKIIRSILLNRDTSQGQPLTVTQSELRVQNPLQDKDKRPPRPPSMQLLQKDTNGASEGKIVHNDLHAVPTEKQERRTKNKDRPDRGVWAPLRRSDGSHASDDSLSSSGSQTSQVLDPAEGTRVERKHEMPVARGGDYRSTGSGRGNNYSADNGSSYRGGRRGSAYIVKDADGYSTVEGKPLKKVGASVYGPNEKRVWVQKSGSGT
ncbi:hypothetical protein ACP275_02G077300 [Erythranthe tilingii]